MMKGSWRAVVAIGWVGLGCVGEEDATPQVAATDPYAAVGEIEQRIGGRIGTAIVSEDGEVLAAYRGDERFAMCSTFKLALSAAVLEHVEDGTMTLDDALPFGETDLLSYAPVAREHIDAGQMTIGQAAEGTVTLSDNTAANLLLAEIGGPEGLTAFFRSHGDDVSRLDRIEPELNENAPGDERDTTSPIAMAALIQRLTFTDALAAESREQLAAWAVANQTGDRRIRAGIPDGWRVGDKTGSCGTAFNDVGIVWPPSGPAFVLSAYIDRPTAEASEADAAIAEIAQLAVQLISEHDQR
ncbi:MAG: class A beta-lactamase [Gemmatimonadota bacterium]